MPTRERPVEKRADGKCRRSIFLSLLLPFSFLFCTLSVIYCTTGKNSEGEGANCSKREGMFPGRGRHNQEPKCRKYRHLPWTRTNTTAWAEFPARSGRKPLGAVWLVVSSISCVFPCVWVCAYVYVFLYVHTRMEGGGCIYLSVWIRMRTNHVAITRSPWKQTWRPPSLSLWLCGRLFRFYCGPVPRSGSFSVRKVLFLDFAAPDQRDFRCSKMKRKKKEDACMLKKNTKQNTERHLVSVVISRAPEWFSLMGNISTVELMPEPFVHVFCTVFFA